MDWKERFKRTQGKKACFYTTRNKSSGEFEGWVRGGEEEEERLKTQKRGERGATCVGEPAGSSWRVEGRVEVNAQKG
jgi:hypothetical protein